jgi:DNA polymerase III delta prime subunit
MTFQKATKKGSKLRMALEGPPGSGKTYTALRVGRGLVGTKGRIAVVDTERGSASKYSDDFDFDVVELDAFAPQTFVECIQAAAAEGYDLLVIDSLSHAWMGTDGMLEQVDKAAKRKQSGNTFSAWKDVNPQERGLWDAMLGCPMHLITTLRTKSDYVIEEQDRGGRKIQVPKKIGLAPVQREGLEYEFDIVARMDAEQTLTVEKTRCKHLTGYVETKPGEKMAIILAAWLDGASPAEPRPLPTPTNGTAKPSADSAERNALFKELCAALGGQAQAKDALKRRGCGSLGATSVAVLRELLADAQGSEPDGEWPEEEPAPQTTRVETTASGASYAKVPPRKADPLDEGDF